MINAVLLYRLAHWLYVHKVPFIPKIVKLIIFLCYNCSLPYECTIGRNSFLGYGGIGVVIHKNAVIGDNVIIGPNVTIGGRSNRANVPIIGNNVYISTGAKILGDITIGDRVIIGANAVVISSVPSDSVVAGVPARIIKQGADVYSLCNLEHE
ncbi:serine acetyltransferase [Geobacter sulfurreducens]|uniref:serine O-acetyltransferase n=1 Tax=Geobacter sulfurreducens TaxID=35554 RepID=UPI001BDBB862|nr:serine O-acetyltransferase [Geobacter sulfurreducens]QVW33802.1 serine acetyltransferase [Geobacter sulfurreducens]